MTFHLLACLPCDEADPEFPFIIPFGDATERADWAEAHAKATGHNRFAFKTEEDR